MSSASTLTVIVRASGPDAPVRRLVDSLATEPGVGLEVVILHGPGWREVAPRLQGPLPLRHRFVAGDVRSGAALNRIIEECRTDWVAIAEPADLLRTGYYAAAVTALEADPRPGYAVVPTTFHPGTAGGAMPELLASPWAFCAPVLRRASWRDAGGFSESLDLTEWDLLLSLEAGGAAGL